METLHCNVGLKNLSHTAKPKTDHVTENAHWCDSIVHRCDMKSASHQWTWLTYQWTYAITKASINTYKKFY